ncbi:hypothetical protein KFL_000340410 [Klebsormidium nitens]|uniref:Uncharacterized protein n=1 Tax=Klebsormidium nitens TaxID=105231 RepID=A0A1Y1HR34_KLENI|nr:hypothetical protein KFL_000340410 [Klebsormidium nitens]|eukprot:GAQ79639.1 hypothetical protein KFL_000340410 [Klebsormidium nitens]
MNYKIKSVRNEDGGTAYSILACADDVEARRHKRDPWGAKFVNIALSSFNQPGADEGQNDTEVGRREVEIASTNVHVRVELIKCMKDNLAKTTAEAVKHHKSVRRNTKKNGRKGRNGTVEVDEMEERGEGNQTKEDSSRVFVCEETYERLRALNVLPPSDDVVEPAASMPVNLGLQQVADSLEGLSCPNFLPESDLCFDLEKEAGETLESVIEKLFPSGVFTAPSAAIEREAAEQLVDLRPFEHLILPVTKHLTLGESDEDVSVDGENFEHFLSHADSGVEEKPQQHSIFEREAFEQWLQDQGGRRLQTEARPKESITFQPPASIGDQLERSHDGGTNVNETEAYVSPSQYQLAALEEQPEKTSGNSYYLDPEEDLEEVPFTEDFDPVEQFEQEMIDPASPHNLEAESERPSKMYNDRPPSKPPSFDQDQPFRPQFKQRKTFAALELIVKEHSEVPLEEVPPEVNPENPSEASQQFEGTRLNANPIRPSFKPLRSSRLLERLEEAIQKEEVEENIESFDVEEKENHPPEPEEGEQEHKNAASPKQGAFDIRFEEEGEVYLPTPKSKTRNPKGGGSKKKLNRTDLVIAISERDVYEAKQYQRRPLGKQKIYKPVKDFEQLLLAPEPESVSFDDYAGGNRDEKPLLPELVLEPGMFKRALSRPIDDFHHYRKLLLTDPFKLPGCFKADESAQEPVGNAGDELPDTPPPAPSWPAPWDPERLDRRANPAEGEASLDAPPRDAYVTQQGTEEEFLDGPGATWQEVDFDTHFDAVSGSPNHPEQSGAVPYGDEAPQFSAREPPTAPPGDTQIPPGATPVGNKQLTLAGRKRYRLEQMVAEAVEAERRAWQERLKRQDLGPVSAALLKGLGDAHREGRRTSAEVTCLTMGQLARRCFGRDGLTESADASPHRCFVALLHVATQHNIGGSQASSMARCSIRLHNPGSKIEEVVISVVRESS